MQIYVQNYAKTGTDMKLSRIRRSHEFEVSCALKIHFGDHGAGLVLAAFLSMLSVGCGAKPSPVMPMQVDGEDAIPSRLPTADQMFEVTAPSYQPPANVKSECFGRLVFEVGGKVHWPTYFIWQDSDLLFSRSFSPKVADPGDIMRFGNTHIAVIGSVGEVKKERVFESTPTARIAHLRMRIGQARASIGQQKKQAMDTVFAQKEIAEVKEWIGEREKTIKEIQAEFELFDPGLPESQGYWTSTYYGNDETNLYSVLRAYVTRGEYVYIFESEERMKSQSDKDAHKVNFSDMLAKFRTRAPNEIPTEPGVCFPHGFIPDDGRTVVEFKQSLRYPDAPGVLYTIETGTVHPRRMKLTPVTAMAHAIINPPPTSDKDEIRPVITQRIAPRTIKMGGLSAIQGGTVLKAGVGNDEYEIYSVFSGYSGWLGTMVLPYILVEMQTVNRERAPEIKQKPPPFEQSKVRLDLILKSMRWRPTTPTMSEFVRK